MSLNNSQYDTLIRQYNARQFHNQHLLDERIQEVYGKCPAPLFCGQTVRGPKVKYSAKRHASTSYRERGHPCPGAACLDF